MKKLGSGHGRLLIICIFSSIFINHGISQGTDGFYSIDCGNTATKNYTDEETGIVWTPDSAAGIMPAGESVSVPGGATLYTRYQTFRFFPDMANHTKYCYSNPAVQVGGIYIVRAGFYYGGAQGVYGANTDQVSFKFIIDSFVASDVTIDLTNEISLVTMEFYVKANTSQMYACVAPGEDAPFISSIEFRLISTTNNWGALAVELFRYPLLLITRVNFGLNTTHSTRYPDDQYDRIWSNIRPETILSTSNPISTTNAFDVAPQKVLQTSWAPTYTVENYDYIYTPTFNINQHLYLQVLYFAEINSTVDAEGMRVFEVGVNDTGKGSQPLAIVDIFKLAGGSFSEMVLFNITQISGPWINITLTPTSTSTLLPIISGMEIFQFLDSHIPLGTALVDFTAIQSFIGSLSSQLGDYIGDPCLPQRFGFPWLVCRYAGDIASRITEIDLSNKGLSGEIPTSLNSLTELTKISLHGNSFTSSIPNLHSLVNLEELDLSNNKLSGEIPTFLTKLPNLKTLNLQNNNLSGSIPSELLNNHNLDFKYSGNANLVGSSNSSPSSSSNSSSSVPLIIGVVVGVVVLVVVVIIIILCYVRLKKSRQNVPCDQQTKLSYTGEIEVGINKANTFSYRDIMEATKNFADLLGCGGFGDVFKGRLPDGREIAIKILSSNDNQGQGVQEFKNEASLLSTVHHKNIVQLLGYCVDQKLALVYELMPNGSLFHALSSSKIFLDWFQRLAIMLDVAQGLNYLHHQCVNQIIHRDVKSTNILLDNNFRGKVADLGISKDNDGATRLMGSFGYLDPEYAQTMNLTTMVDIYSFGVVLLEIITGKSPMLRTEDERDLRLVDWVKPLVESGNLDALVDARLRYNEDTMWNVVDIAIRCTKLQSSQRPQTMGEIVTCLSKALEIESKENYTQPITIWEDNASNTEPFPQMELSAR